MYYVNSYWYYFYLLLFFAIQLPSGTWSVDPCSTDTNCTYNNYCNTSTKECTKRRGNDLDCVRNEHCYSNVCQSKKCRPCGATDCPSNRICRVLCYDADREINQMCESKSDRQCLSNRCVRRARRTYICLKCTDNTRCPPNQYCLPSGNCVATNHVPVSGPTIKPTMYGQPRTSANTVIPVSEKWTSVHYVYNVSGIEDLLVNKTNESKSQGSTTNPFSLSIFLYLYTLYQ